MRLSHLTFGTLTPVPCFLIRFLGILDWFIIQWEYYTCLNEICNWVAKALTIILVFVNVRFQEKNLDNTQKTEEGKMREIDQSKVVSQILFGTSEAGKTYEFDEGHDPNLPSQWWFQESDEGLILFVVFHTQACRWSQCISCSLPSKCSKQPVGYKSLLSQINYIFDLPEISKRRLAIRKVILSNNGSVLDQLTFSSMALMYLVMKLNLHFPKLAVLSIETRPEYVEIEELDFLARGIAEGDTPTELELAVGFELFDDHLRNNVLKKGLRKEVFENLVAKMAPYGFRLKCYVMQKPVPGMTSEEAIQDVRNSFDYFHALYRKHDGKVKFNVHLNPTYVARGTILEPAFERGDYTPPSLQDVATAVKHARDLPISVYIGLDDEGLAVLGGSFIRPGDELILKKLKTFNERQDYSLLP